MAEVLSIDYGRPDKMNKVISPLPQVQKAVHKAGERAHRKAERLMQGARDVTNKTDHHIEGGRIPAESYGGLDYFISMVGPAPLSVEFGHFIHNAAFPRYVVGQYILYRAAGLI